MNRIHALGLAFGLLVCGCHNFTIVNGKPAMDQPAANYDDKLHSAVIGDFVMIDPPVPLPLVCPQGWARIERRVSFVDGLIDILARFSAGGAFYKADSITVHCAQGSSASAVP